MLIQEVTNAEDQLSLLKKIFDNTWSTVAAEAQAEKAAQQQRAAAAASKPRARRTAKPIAKPVPKAATTAVKPTQATAAEKTAADIVQRGDTSAQQQAPQSQLQPRRVYPSTTAKPKPLARLGKVATVANLQ